MSDVFNVAFWSVNGEYYTHIITIVGDPVMIGICFEGENACNPTWFVVDRKIVKCFFLMCSCAARITVDNDWYFDDVDTGQVFEIDKLIKIL